MSEMGPLIHPRELNLTKGCGWNTDNEKRKFQRRKENQTKRRLLLRSIQVVFNHIQNDSFLVEIHWI